MVCGHCLVTLSITSYWNIKWLSSLPTLMQESFWWWQCSDRYIISLFSHLHTHFPPFSPSLISLMISVDVKHHAHLLAGHKTPSYLLAFTHYSVVVTSASFPFFPLAQIQSESDLSTCSITQFIPVVYSPSSSLWFILPVHPCGLFYQFIPLVYPPCSPLWFILPVHPSGLSTQFIPLVYSPSSSSHSLISLSSSTDVSVYCLLI